MDDNDRGMIGQTSRQPAANSSPIRRVNRSFYCHRKLVQLRMAANQIMHKQ